MDWVHIHLALNHIPVIGIPFALLTVICGWVRPRRDVLMFGLWLVALTTAAGIGIKFTGDEAAEMLNRANDPIITRHEESADQATTAIFVLFLASAASIFSGRRGQRVHKWLLIAVVLAGLVTCGLLVRTANLGGQIAHPELR